jgi:hypothetical protein
VHKSIEHGAADPKVAICGPFRQWPGQRRAAFRQTRGNAWVRRTSHSTPERADAIVARF